MSSLNRHYLCCSTPFPREKKAEIAAIANEVDMMPMETRIERVKLVFPILGT